MFLVRHNRRFFWLLILKSLPLWIDNSDKIDVINQQEPLGKGSYGGVYECVFNGEFAAIKLSEIPGSPRPKAISHLVSRSFCNEFEFFKTCPEHPHLIRFLSPYTIKGKLSGLVMERWGESLSHYLLHESHLFRPVAVKGIIMQLLSALAYVHRRGIAHADIKPGNLVAQLGDHGMLHIKLIDFGLSVFRRDQRQSGARGSLAFLSPEMHQVKSSKTKADWSAFAAADIWACAVLSAILSLSTHPLNYLAQLDHAMQQRIAYHRSTDAGQRSLQAVVKKPRLSKKRIARVYTAYSLQLLNKLTHRLELRLVLRLLLQQGCPAIQRLCQSALTLEKERPTAARCLAIMTSMT